MLVLPAAFPRALVPRGEDPRPCGLPLGRAAFAILIYIQWAGERVRCLASMTMHSLQTYPFVQPWTGFRQRGTTSERESRHVCLRWPLTKVQTKFIATDGRTSDPLRDPATLNVSLVAHRHVDATPGGMLYADVRAQDQLLGVATRARSQSVGPRDYVEAGAVGDRARDGAGA